MFLDISMPSSSFDCHIGKFWTCCWKLNLPAKVEIFCILYLNGLLFGLALFRRGCIENPLCRLCGFNLETFEHLLLNCWCSRALWSKFGVPSLFVNQSFQRSADLLVAWYQQLSPDFFSKCLVTLRYIWYNRNMV